MCEGGHVGPDVPRLMLGQPRLLYGLAVLLIAVVVVAAGRAPPAIDPGEAERFEGQRVRVEGLAGDVRVSAEGTTRFTLIFDGEGLAVVAPAAVEQGAWVEAEGRLGRAAGRLTLYADDVRTADAPAASAIAWPDLAANPGSFAGRVLLLQGVVHKDELAQGRYALPLGSGEWPASGPVRVVGSVAYAAECFCFRIDALQVDPWTP